jgi:hypothetical protein
MLDPRIYRTGFAAVALAVIVFAFSLNDQQGPLSSPLAPDAFNGTTAFTTLQLLAGPNGYPDRRPGSVGDDALATYVAGQLRKIQGLNVSTSLSTVRTVDGMRTVETVTAVRPGLAPGSIVVVAHRDALGAPAQADLSGTAVMLELAQVLAGETPHRTIVFESISGSAGAAGATQLARSLAGPVDAVIALGNLASTTVRQPVVVPWSDSQDVAPPLLRKTVGATVAAQAGVQPGDPSLGSQLAHLALPLTLSEQGPFGEQGLPAVLISLSSEHAPATTESVGNGTMLGNMGQAVLQSVNALDAGRDVPAPAPYLLIQGKVVPAWAVRLLVLALILPVLIATIDGLARARRRGHSITRWIVWVLASALPFALALVVVLGARTIGMIADAPPGPVAGGVVPLGGSGIVLLLGVGLAIVLGFVLLRRAVIAAARADRRLAGNAPEGAGIAVLLVMCLTALAIWLRNPFAALLLVPALHLWMWILDADVRLRPVVCAVLLVIGLLPPIMVIVYFAHSLSLTPVGVVWNALLLLLGGQVGVVVALEWAVLLGCVASVIALALRALREPAPEQLPITVRGPVGYAGPGSLGGTESALRR